MKYKIFITALIFLFITGFTFGQSSLPKGKSQLNLGVGLSDWGIPVYIGFDHSVHNDVTIGLELSYRSYRENWHKDHYNHSIMGISGNLNYHFNTIFNIPPRWDLYAGINAGFYVWRSPNEYYGSHSSGLGIGGQLGGRYFFTDKLGFNLEFGGGNAFSGGKFGLTIKL